MFNVVALCPHGRSEGLDGDAFSQEMIYTAGGSEERFPVASEEVSWSKSSVCPNLLWIVLTSSMFIPKTLNTPSHSFSFTDGFFVLL
jgi:hypothetical protein